MMDRHQMFSALTSAASWDLQQLEFCTLLFLGVQAETAADRHLLCAPAVEFMSSCVYAATTTETTTNPANLQELIAPSPQGALQKNGFRWRFSCLHAIQDTSKESQELCALDSTAQDDSQPLAIYCTPGLRLANCWT